MTLKPLRNTDFKFPSLCFVCDQGNERGMQVPFALDTERGRVVAELNLGQPFSGAPNYVHGGAIAAVLDEATAWAVIALLERFGITRRSETSYKKPLLIGETYQVEAWVEEQEDRKVTARAQILGQDGEVHAEFTGKYRVMDRAEAEKAIGQLSGNEAGYVRE
ncbi:MAG: PaaI family thioesterase [Dehalococcoidia bacterium]